jgi:integrase
MRGGLIDEPLTLREFSDRYLARYEADRSAVTVRTLKWRLVRPLDEFGDVKLSELGAGDVDKLAGEVRSRFAAAIIVGAWCYLRPSELLALERGDVDGNELRVRRTLDGSGSTKASGKTRRSLRTVPLPLRARQALAELPPRLRYPPLVPGTVRRAVRRLQLATARVQMGRRSRRVRERHAVHAAPQRDLVGTRGRGSDVGCGPGRRKARVCGPFS